MPSESPTSSSGTPASSSSFAIGKSYTVSAAIFSPRAFIARIVSTVILEFIFNIRELRELTRIKIQQKQFVKIRAIRGLNSFAETRHQFLRRGRCRAAFADDDAGGVVRQNRRFIGRRPRRNRQRERGDDRVACAGNVEHFLSDRGNVKRLLPALAQQHSKFTERDRSEEHTSE